MLRWPQLDALWERVRENREGWYVYVLDALPPAEPEPPERLLAFIKRLDRQLRREHVHDYCGIVYADNITAPQMIKVYDPGNLGAVCGSSGQRILPRWVLSRIKPTPLAGAVPGPPAGMSFWRRLIPRL